MGGDPVCTAPYVLPFAEAVPVAVPGLVLPSNERTLLVSSVPSGCSTIAGPRSRDDDSVAVIRSEVFPFPLASDDTAVEEDVVVEVVWTFWRVLMFLPDFGCRAK